MSKLSLNNGFKLLETIRNNTDETHPLSQNALRKILGNEKSAEIMGDKGTYARRLRELADAYNTDFDGNVKPTSEWKIVYPGYNHNYENIEDTENLPQNKHTVKESSKNGKVYYNHPVSEVELGFLISCIRDSHSFTDEEKTSLEKRISEALRSNHYEYNDWQVAGFIRKLDSADDLDYTKIEHNISELRKYINSGMMVDIMVECDSETGLFQVSPYRIVHKDGYYWLIANWHERPGDTIINSFNPGYKRKFPWYTDSLSAYRIDLIEKIEQAYVPDETTVHWTMTKTMMSGKYTRRNAGSKRKARLNDEMIRVLEKFDQNAGRAVLNHCGYILYG